MTSVLILGAGASVPAGYPTAQELLPRMREEATKSAAVQFHDAWNRWETFLAALPPALAVVRSCSNPEIVLSLPDLFDATAESEDRSQTVGAIHDLHNTGRSAVEGLNAYFASPGREILSEARAARAHLVYCLDWFFSFRHHDDGRRTQIDRDYLRTHLSPLVRGDAVITFNWDTLVERTLAEDGRWCPADGYGFPRQLVQESGNGIRHSIPAHLAPPSELVVLKLHGSYGWRILNDRFFLDGPEYLAGFTFPLLDAASPLLDGDEPTDYSPSDVVMAYPSFFKQLARPILAGIWTLASGHLSRATFVEIIGYSLPESDSAARALLLPLILRLDSGAARVVVQDRSAGTLDRWRRFLGPKAELREEQLQQ